MTELEELRSYADDAKSQIDKVVLAAQNLIAKRAGESQPTPKEIIFPSAEMLGEALTQ